jgi:hypothetical protein
MIIVCAWHRPEPIVLGEKEPYEDRNITGGICEECREREFAELEDPSDVRMEKG